PVSPTRQQGTTITLAGASCLSASLGRRSEGRFFPLVADGHDRVGVWIRDGKLLLPQEFDVFLHAPFRLVETVFDRVADAREAFQIWREETEKVRFVSRLDDEGIGQIDHAASFKVWESQPPSGWRCTFRWVLPSIHDNRHGRVAASRACRKSGSNLSA